MMKSLPALAAALLPDPFYQAITVEFAASNSARLRVLEAYFGYSMLEAQRTGRCVFAPREGDGAAAWLLPRTTGVDAVESRNKADFMSQLLGPKGDANYRGIIELMAPRAARHMPPDAWYLSIIGIHPGAQGRGLGAALLRPTLDETGKQGVAAYLETFTPRNLAFYRKPGFDTVAEHLEPVTNSRYVVMRRDA